MNYVNIAGLDPGTSDTDYGVTGKGFSSLSSQANFFLIPKAVDKTADLNTVNVVFFIRAENTNCFSTVYLLVLTSLVQLLLVLETLCTFFT